MRSWIIGTWRDDTPPLVGATQTIRESIYGLAGDDTMAFYRGTYTGRANTGDPDFSDRFFGGWGDDRLTNLVINWFDETDYEAYAPVSYDGGPGTDTITFDIAMSLRAFTALSLGRFEAITHDVEIREFVISATAQATHTTVLNVNGNGENESVKLSFMGEGSVNAIFRMADGDDRVEYFADQDVSAELRVFTGNGNDTVIINATQVHNSNTEGTWIGTGRGSDTIVLEGMHREVVYASDGNDHIYLLTGNFAENPDTVFTGAGRDRVYVELDQYSQLATIKWFSAREDTIVFDRNDPRLPEVVFDAADWQTGEEANLYMNNATGELFYGENLMIDFNGPTNLTAANFVADDWDYWV